MLHVPKTGVILHPYEYFLTVVPSRQQPLSSESGEIVLLSAFKVWGEVLVGIVGHFALKNVRRAMLSLYKHDRQEFCLKVGD